MLSLARLTLKYEWKRYLAAVLAVSFSGLLILVQVGLLLGMFGTVTRVLDEARADLWVVSKGTESFDLAREMPNRIELRLRRHPAVKDVQTMALSFGDWRTPTGSKVSVYVHGLELRGERLGMPVSFPSTLAHLLSEPGSVVVDRSDLGKLHVKIGETAEINNKRVRIVGTVDGFKAIGGANVFASLETARDLLDFMIRRDYSQYFLIKMDGSIPSEQLRLELQTLDPTATYEILHPNELSARSQIYWLLESGSGLSFGFSALLGMIVGIAITSQTLRGAILSAIREYATLRALGVSVASLRNVVLEQAFWVGLIGLALATGLSALILGLAKTQAVSMELPWWTFLFTGVFTILVALLSGLLSLAPLYKTEPAELLR